MIKGTFIKLLLALPFWGLIPNVHGPDWLFKWWNGNYAYTVLTYDDQGCWNVWNGQNVLVYQQCEDGSKQEGPAFISYQDLSHKLRTLRNLILKRMSGSMA